MLNPVAPPPLLKPVVNLIDSMNHPVDLTAGRWISGSAFRPWPNTSGWVDNPRGQRVPNDQAAGAPGLWTIYPGNGAEGLGTIDYRPVVFRVYDKASAFGYSVKDYADRARVLADVTIYKQLERELWTGEGAQLVGVPNPYLTNPATVQNLSTFVTGGTPTVVRGVEILEQALADYGAGTRGVIHCRPEALSPALQNTVRRDGNRILTMLDNVIVPGVGYPNTGPGGAAAGYAQTWLYATGWVDVDVDPAKIIPNPADYTNGLGMEDLTGFIGAAMDRSINLVVTRAARFAAARFDPQCHFAIKVALDV